MGKWKPGRGISRGGSLEGSPVRTLGLERGKCMETGDLEKTLQGLGSKAGFGGMMGWGTGEGPCEGRVRRKEQGRSLAGWEGLKHQKMGLED